MKRIWIARGLKIAVFVALAIAVVSFVVMSLWNWLMPALFGWQPVSFWQALGLLVLSRILFGGLRGRPGYGMHWRRRMAERWEQMSPEEREKFREGMRGGCGHIGPTATDPKV
jgi:hypothetical protein